MNGKTYIKPKINPSEKLEYHLNDLLSRSYFPRFKYQLSTSVRFSKFVNGKEKVFKKWIKSDLTYNHTNEIVHNPLMQKLDEERLERSGFVFQCIVDVTLQIHKVNDIQASLWVELPENYNNDKSIINMKKRSILFSMVHFIQFVSSWGS